MIRFWTRTEVLIEDFLFIHTNHTRTTHTNHKAHTHKPHIFSMSTRKPHNVELVTDGIVRDVLQAARIPLTAYNICTHIYTRKNIPESDEHYSRDKSDVNRILYKLLTDNTVYKSAGPIPPQWRWNVIGGKKDTCVVY